MKLTIATLFVFLGCGDNGMSASPDAAIDARPDVCPCDAPPDATTPDAGPTFSGLVLLADFKVQDHPELGHGGIVDIQFTRDGTAPTPQMHIDDTAGGIGCTGDLYTAAQLANPSVGIDEGSVAITGTSATIPTCTFISGQGYLCIGQSAQGMITITPGSQGTATVVINNATFSSADAGRFLDIRGDTTNTSNNGRFPIIQTVSATTVVIGNPAAQVSTFTGIYTTIAGAGPVPNGPSFLEATDNVTIALTPGGAHDFPAFSCPNSCGGQPMHGVAPFALTAASAALIRAMPTDGSAVTLDCDINAGACDGTLTLVSIETTDGSISNLPPYVMPPATGHVARVNCAFVSRTANIPADIMALVMTAAPTRIQTFYVRMNFTQTQDTNQTSFVLGRGIAGYTSP